MGAVIQDCIIILFIISLSIQYMNAFTIILLIIVIGGGAYFSYWAIQKTLEDPKPTRTPRKEKSHNNKHHEK